MFLVDAVSLPAQVAYIAVSLPAKVAYIFY